MKAQFASLWCLHGLPLQNLCQLWKWEVKWGRSVIGMSSAICRKAVVVQNKARSCYSHILMLICPSAATNTFLLFGCCWMSWVLVKTMESGYLGITAPSLSHLPASPVALQQSEIAEVPEQTWSQNQGSREPVNPATGTGFRCVHSPVHWDFLWIARVNTEQYSLIATTASWQVGLCWKSHRSEPYASEN